MFLLLLLGLDEIYDALLVIVIVVVVVGFIALERGEAVLGFSDSKEGFR